MKVLSIGTDRKLFEKGSEVSERVILYGSKMEELHIIVFSTQKVEMENSKLKISENVFVYSTNSSSRWFFVWDAIKLGKKIIVEEKFVRGASVITTQDPFECGFVGWRLSKIFRLPLHVQIHTDFLSPYFKTSFHQRVRVMIAKFILPKARGVRVVSQRIADSIKHSNIRLTHEPQILPILVEVESPKLADDAFSKLRAAPHGSGFWQVLASEKASSASLGQPSFAFTILMASRLTKEKRIKDALLAFKQVVEEFPYVGLVIAGVGSEKNNLEIEVERLGISKSVHFIGWQEDIFAVMKSAQIFLSTSEYEGYGMSMIRAGHADLAIVATDTGIVGEILKDNETALICPVGDIVCLSRAISRLIADNDLRFTLSQNLKALITATLPSRESYVTAYVQGLADIQK